MAPGRGRGSPTQPTRPVAGPRCVKASDVARSAPRRPELDLGLVEHRERLAPTGRDQQHLANGLHDHCPICRSRAARCLRHGVPDRAPPAGPSKRRASGSPETNCDRIANDPEIKQLEPSRRPGRPIAPHCSASRLGPLTAAKWSARRRPSDSHPTQARSGAGGAPSRSARQHQPPQDRTTRQPPDQHNIHRSPSPDCDATRTQDYIAAKRARKEHQRRHAAHAPPTRALAPDADGRPRRDRRTTPSLDIGAAKGIAHRNALGASASHADRDRNHRKAQREALEHIVASRTGGRRDGQPQPHRNHHHDDLGRADRPHPRVETKHNAVSSIGATLVDGGRSLSIAVTSVHAELRVVAKDTRTVAPAQAEAAASTVASE